MEEHPKQKPDNLPEDSNDLRKTLSDALALVSKRMDEASDLANGRKLKFFKSAVALSFFCGITITEAYEFRWEWIHGNHLIHQRVFFPLSDKGWGDWVNANKWRRYDMWVRMKMDDRYAPLGTETMFRFRRMTSRVVTTALLNLPLFDSSRMFPVFRESFRVSGIDYTNLRNDGIDWGNRLCYRTYRHSAVNKFKFLRSSKFIE